MGDSAWAKLWEAAGSVLISLFALIAAFQTGRGINKPGDNQTVTIPAKEVGETSSPVPASTQVDLTGQAPSLIEALRTMAETLADTQQRLAEQARIIGTLQLEKSDHEVIRLAFIEVVNWIDDGCPPGSKPSIRLGIRRALGMVTE